MKRAAVFIAAISLALSAQTQQARTGQINGHVVDPKGAYIADAAVFVRAYRKASDKIELMTHTDRNGDFTLTVPEDAYDIVVSSPGFKSVLRTVVGSPRKSNRITFTLPIEDCDFPGVNCDTFQ